LERGPDEYVRSIRVKRQRCRAGAVQRFPTLWTLRRGGFRAAKVMSVTDWRTRFRREMNEDATNWRAEQARGLTKRSTGAQPFRTLCIFKLLVAAPG
jgi:hypothetical protein